MSETNQKSAGYKRSKFIASRIFGKFSNPSKQSPMQSNRSCHSFDEPPKQFSTADSSFAGWDKDEGGGLAEDELIFIFPDRPLTPFWPSDTEDGKRKSNSEDLCCHPVSNPFSTRQNAHPSPVDRRARLRPVNQRIPKNEITRNLRMDQEITLQMRLMRTQNVWCIPDVSRGDSELLLANTDPGNFILRVSQTQHAMVLSRRVRIQHTESGRISCVEHNVIEVFPRSGYCLTGDRNAHLIFGSLVELLTFYIRVSRNRVNGGPFLRLPRAVLNAETLGDLEQINKQGVDFWTNTFASRQQSSGIRAVQKDSMIRDQNPRPDDIPVRPCSMDRWSGRNHDVSASAKQSGQPLNSRSRQHQSRVASQSDVKHTGLVERGEWPGVNREPRSISVSTADYIRARFDGCRSNLTYLCGDEIHRDELTKEATSNSQLSKMSSGRGISKPAGAGHQTDSIKAATNNDRPQANGRCHAAQTRIYEGSEGELWPAKSPLSSDKLPFRQHPAPPNVMREIPRASAPSGRPWMGPSPNMNEAPQSSSQDTMGHSSFNHSHRTPPNGLLSRTLEEHLLSEVPISMSSNVSANKSQTRILKAANSIQWPYNNSDAEVNPELQTNGLSHTSQSDDGLLWSTVDHCDEKSPNRSQWDSAPVVNQLEEIIRGTKQENCGSVGGMPGSNRSGQSIELPAPKTVGRVFVMEAATYSSDDYELLCDSGSTKPRLGRLPLTSMCSVRNTPGSGIDESNQLAVKGIIKPRLRRSQTERDRNRVPFNRVNSEDERTAEDIQPRRHQKIFLEDLLYGRENESNGTGNTVKDTKDRDSPKIPTASRPCADEVDRGEFVQSTHPLYDPRLPSTTLRDRVPSRQLSERISHINSPRRISKSRLYSLTKKCSVTPDSKDSDQDSPVLDEPKSLPTDPKEVQTTPPVLTLLAAPRVASATVPLTSTDDARQFFEWEPPPPPPGPPPPLCRPEDDQCDPSSDQGRPQMQHRLSETSNLSPSQSSRASTVFCPPWDTAPVGLYLSDLISLCRPLPGPTAGNGSETSRRVRDSMLRRRTLSTLEHRWLSERLSSFIDTDSAGRTEFQKLLGLWMQSNPTERVEKEQGSGEEAAPPPLPQRRRRTRGHKGNATTCGVPDDMRSSKVKPYAIFTCPTYKGAADEIRREDLWKEQPRSHFETNDSFGVYDEAFVGQETGPSSPKDPVISKSGSTEPESANAETGAPGSYVYAQVVPYHLRRQHQSQEKSPSPAVKHEELGSVADRIAKFQGKPIMSLVRTSSTSLKSRTGKDSNENTELVEPQDQTSTLVQSPPVSSSSHSSSSEDSGCGHGDSAVGAHDLPHRPPVAEAPDQTANPNRESGRHIRYFVHRLLKNKNSKVAEQVNLFLECTREGSERGPYRTMQSIRQFITGMTNYLLRNPDLGLPAAVEMEKQDLPEFGFLNVGALLESTLQKHILRPLYRHVIKLLKQEQVKHNELDPVRAQVQRAWSTPAEQLLVNETDHESYRSAPTQDAVNHVTQLFRRMERTYSVGRKMNYLMDIFDTIRTSITASGKTKDDVNGQCESIGDYEPLYTWVFARAGLLLAPLASEHWDQPRPWTNRQISVFCPVALQADYLEGLIQKSQLHNQARSQTCLNDLFSTLYWIWGQAGCIDQTRNSSLPRRTPGGSQPDLDRSDTLGSTSSRSGLPIPVGVYVNHTTDKDDLENSDFGPCSVPADGFFGSTKRRIIPPRRRKTITGLQWTKNSAPSTTEAQSGCSTASAKLNGWFKSNTLLQNGATRPPITTSQDTLATIPSQHALPRWRPWAPQFASQTSSNDLSSQDRPYLTQFSVGQPHPLQQLRVLVMDEANNQMQYHSYPLRPNLTVNELSNMIAFKMKIFDPKEFNLFAFIDGKEHALDDSFRLADFTDSSTDLQGSLTTLPARSATGTLSSVRERPTLLTPQTGKVALACSVSSRSGSPTSSSNDSQGQNRRLAHRGLRMGHTNPWWVLCKKLPSSSNENSTGSATRHTGVGATGSETEMVGPASTAIDVVSSPLLGNSRPLLIFRRASGYFAISDRLLQCLSD